MAGREWSGEREQSQVAHRLQSIHDKFLRRRKVNMASDNVFDQIEALISSDQRQALPESVETILNAISKLPGAGPLVWAVRYESEKQRAENSDLMLRTAWQELKRVSFDFDKFRQNTMPRDEVRKLVVDAMRKAEDIRDRKRVERIGKILAHAITLEGGDFDKAEEMMRVARDLSDQDVLALGHLYDTQFSTLQQNRLQVNADEINKIWRGSPARITGVIGSESESLFLKLQGLGLASAVERRDTQLGPNERPFALLPKGADFVRYIQGAVESR